MVTYRFRLGDGSEEEHDLQLPDDDAAVREGLRTAADLVLEQTMQRAGVFKHHVAVRESGGDTILRIDVRIMRER